MAKIEIKDVENFIDTLNKKFRGKCNYGYGFMTSRKYHKVCMLASKNEFHSAYCFINKDNGDIYMAAGWNGPERTHIRGNILTNISNCKEFGISYLR